MEIGVGVVHVFNKEGNQGEVTTENPVQGGRVLRLSASTVNDKMSCKHNL